MTKAFLRIFPQLLFSLLLFFLPAWNFAQDCTNDQTPPMVTCPDDQVVAYDANCEAVLGDYLSQVTVSDNCDPNPALSQSPAAGSTLTGSVTVTILAEDQAGNTNDCSFLVEPADQDAPQLSLPADLTQNCGQSTAPPTVFCGPVPVLRNGILLSLSPAGTASVKADQFDLATQDGCNSDSLIFSFSPVTTDTSRNYNCADVGTHPLTIYVTDSNGNQNQVQTFVDVQDPAGHCAAPAGCGPAAVLRNGLVLNLPNAGTAILRADAFDLASVDGCETGSLQFSFSSVADDDSLSVDCSLLGTQSLTIWITDSNGNQVWVNTQVEVLDGTDLCTNGPTGCSPFGLVENGIVAALPPVRSFALPASTFVVNQEDYCTAGNLQWTFSNSGTSQIFTCTELGPQSIDLSLSDGAGNTTEITTELIVQDPAGNCTGPGFATATDNCDPAPNVTWQDATTPNGCPQTYTITRTWTATDAAGNSSSLDQIITVEDTSAPTIECPGNQFESLDANCQFVVPDYTGQATAGDNCDQSPAITQSPQAGTVVSATTTITLTATDACGNAADCTFDLVLSDDMDPTFGCPQDQTVLLDQNCEYSIPDYRLEIAIDDNCDTAPAFAQNPPAGTVISENTTVSITVTDAAGNSTDCSFVLTTNNSGPWFSFTPGDTTVNCAGDVPGQQGVQAFDGCDGEIPVFFTQTPTPFGCPGQGEVINTWIAQNSEDQEITYSQTVTVNDTTPPTFNLVPSDTTVECYDLGYWILLQQNITATDNCNEDLQVIFQPNSTPTCNGSGQVIHSWIAQDCSGNATVYNQVVTLDDNTPPVLSETPADVTVDCYDDVPGDPGVTATDDCDQQLSVTFMQSAAPDCPGSGTVTNTWTATDCAENTTSWTQTVTITDTDAPVFSQTPASVTVDCVDDVPGDPGITAIDNCGETLSVQFAQSTLPTCSDGGTVTNTWTVTDCAGNTNTHLQVITIDHDEDPVFSEYPINLIVSCSDAVPGDPGITATSHCGEELTVSFSQTAMPACVGNGAVVNTWTAVDCAGNTAIHSQYVTVEDTEAPVLSAAPANLTVNCVFDVPNDPGITATDNCGEEIEVQFTQSGLNGSCPGSGTVTNTWTATDCAGNTTIHVQTITLNDTDAPVLSGAPADMTVSCLSDVPGDPGITATDACEGMIDVVFSQSLPPACAGNGTVTNTWTATDCAGNTREHVQVITLDDNDPPVLTSEPADLTVACVADVPGAQGVSATDNCGSQVQVVFTQEGLPFDYANPAPVVNTWTATDCAGNATIHKQIITVSDDVDPVPVCSGLSVALNANGEATISPAVVGDGSSDNCGIAEYLLNQSSFDCNDVGQNQVLLTVVDHFGNSESCTAVIAITASESCTVPPIANAGGPDIADPCSCLSDGAFEEQVVIGPTGSGQAWEVLTTTLINPLTQQPYPAGTPLLQQPDGQGQFIYTLSGEHFDGTGYVLEAVSPFYPGEVLQISNTCYYPEPQILGLDDQVFCQYSNPQTLEGDANGAALDNESFTINGNPATVFDPLALGVGVHEIIYTVDAGTATGFDPTDPGCVASTSMLVEIVATPVGMACNNGITVSTDQNCEALITPDMILEGSYVCYDDYEVTVFDGINQIGNPVTGDYLNEMLFASVEHLPSGNSCGGMLTVVDQLGPVFDCPTDAVEITCTEDEDLIPNPVATDNCTPVTYQLIGEVTADDDICDDNTVVIIRTWTATDAFGNVSAPCEQYIEISRPDDIDFPNDIVWECDQYDLYSNITAATALHPQILALQNGIQEIDASDVSSAAVLSNTGSGVPVPIDGPFCNYGLTYSDQPLSDCGTTFQIVRTWTVFDWCTESVVTSNDAGEDNIQIIKVKDQTDPVVSLSPYQVSANIMGQHPQPCTSQDFLLPPNVTDNCHDFTIQIFTPVGEAEYVNGTDGTNGGLIPAPGLQLGFHNITYQATDICGNTSQLVVQIEVVDDISPVSVCDEITDVSLSSNGQAVVPADIFDDGSIDNCGVSHFQARRLSDNCSIAGNTQFNPTVTFCCADIGQGPIMVAVRVYDFYDNYNECMVQVFVDDNIPPIISGCPGPQTINCEVYSDQLALPLNLGDYSVLDQFGTPLFYDNCTATPDYDVTLNINSCVEGTITRTWSASDPAGNMSGTCTQVITVEHLSNFAVEFPADITFECATNPLPDFGYPEVFFDECEMVGVSWDDQQFDIVQGACYKIVRTWTVINWCLYDAFGEDVYDELSEVEAGEDFDGDGDLDDRTFRDGTNDGPEADGYIVYQQDYKVIDLTAPEFTVPTIDGCIVDTDCDMDLVLPYPNITDVCSEVFEVNLSGSFGSFDDISGDITIPDVGPGDYTVAYTVEDECGNFAFETINFSVEDCKLPTPYCLNGANIEIMQTGMIEVSAASFDLGSFDNCPGELTFSFSSDTADSLRTYDCDDVGFQPIEIWVTDASGNQDFCETWFDLQDNMEVCDQVAVIAGQIATEDYDMMANVMVMVNGGTYMQYTDADGTYAFTLPQNADYTVAPSHDIDAGNGVTTLDLLAIQKHILGIQMLDSPYKMIAADANNTESITTLDMLAIQKVILTLENEFPNNTSWRFVAEDYTFPDPQNPWLEEFPEILNFNNLTSDQLAANFIGVKIGDVNLTANAGLTDDPDQRSIGVLDIYADPIQLTAGATAELEFRIDEAALIGCQFTLTYDPERLRIDAILPGLAAETDFGRFPVEGRLTMSWSNVTRAVSSGEENLFRLRVTAREPANTADQFRISSERTPAEAYLRNGQQLDPVLRYGKPETAVLYPNYPNPFAEGTWLRFSLPKAGPLLIEVSDVGGRVLQTLEIEGQPGYQEIYLDDLPASGLLFYRIETPAGTLSGKMLTL